MVSLSKAGPTTRRTRDCSTSSLCWTRCALQATSDAYSASAVTHNPVRSSPTDTVGNVSTSPLQSFFQVAVHIVTIHQSRSHFHCHSYHNFIAHLRLRLDANMRSACFIAHMCTCIPSFLGLSETIILFLPTHFRVELRHIALQPTKHSGTMYDIRTTYGTRERIRGIERLYDDDDQITEL